MNAIDRTSTALSRRSFLAIGFSAAGGLMIGGFIPAASKALDIADQPWGGASTDGEINAWILIEPDDTVIIRVAQSEAERALVWKGRKAAFAAMGRISPNYIVQDGVIPRTALPQILSEIEQLSIETGLRVANVFHAGDGNLHPLVLYDRRIAGQEKAAEKLSERILELCIEKGGSITGEHGVGEEKKHMMSKMFAEPDLQTMHRVRCAFDPLQLSNPTKVFPRPRMCGETPGEYVAHPLEIAGIAERF